MTNVWARPALAVGVLIFPGCGADSVAKPAAPVTTNVGAAEVVAELTTAPPATSAPVEQPPRNTLGVDGPVVHDGEPVIDPTIGSVDVVSMTASLTGTLLRDGDCLFVATEMSEGIRNFVILFPPGTSWLADDESVRLPDGQILTVGSTVEIGGGGLGVEQVDNGFDSGSALIRSCYNKHRAQGVWVM